MSSTTTEFERAIVAAFQRFDTAHQGYLNRHECKCAFLALFGCKPTKTQLSVFLRGAHEEQGVSWQAFRDCAQALARMQDPNEHIRQVFKAFDREACGFIPRSSAHAAFALAAPSVSSTVVDEVFDELDLDHDGRMSSVDFVTMMRFRVS